MSQPDHPEQSEVPEMQESAPPERKVKLGIWELAWPSILTNLLFSIIGIVSIKIVGTLGADAVAAVTTGHRIFFALQAILMAISAGTTALVARAWGAGDYQEAAKVTSVSLWISNMVSVVLMLPCLIFSEEIAGIFGLAEEPTRLAGDYIFYLSIFNIAFSLNMILGAALRAAGDTKTPLWIGVVTNIVNVIFVYLLVHGLYGFPELGVAGAGIANGFSFAVGGLIFLYLYYSGRMAVSVGGRGSVTEGRVRQLVHIGYPAGIEQFVFQFGFIAFLWLVAFYGTAPYAPTALAYRFFPYRLWLDSVSRLLVPRWLVSTWVPVTMMARREVAGTPFGLRLPAWCC